jgi:hypothetical protein
MPPRRSPPCHCEPAIAGEAIPNGPTSAPISSEPIPHSSLITHHSSLNASSYQHIQRYITSTPAIVTYLSIFHPSIPQTITIRKTCGTFLAISIPRPKSALKSLTSKQYRSILNLPYIESPKGPSSPLHIAREMLPRLIPPKTHLTNQTTYRKRTNANP